MKDKKTATTNAGNKRQLVIAYAKLVKLTSGQEQQLLQYLHRLAAREKR